MSSPRSAAPGCHEMAFAESFAKICPVPGARPADYLHRIVPVPGGGRILAGIRFMGGDLEQPFVDILAWDHDLLTPAAWQAVVRTVSAEFALFRPLRLRTLLTEGRTPPAAPHREPDMLMVAGRLAELREQPAPASSLAITARRATSLDFLPEYDRAMTAFRAGAGALAREVEPTAAEDFQRCIDDGAVIVMHQGSTWAGVAASVRAREWALDGYLEELLDAPSAGAAWAHVCKAI